MKIEDFNLNTVQLKNVEKYIALIIEYNKKLNLISKHTVDDIVDRHILDCIQLVRYIEPKEGLNVADFGSGAGLPGIVLAIMLEKVNFFLIESNGKKATFLKEVCKQLNLKNTTVINDRIENINTKENCFNIITARALADLSLLWKLSSQLLCKDGHTLFLKGRKHQDEITKLLKKYDNLKLDLLNTIAKDSKIIKIYKRR